MSLLIPHSTLRNSKYKIDVLTLCALRYLVMANFFMDGPGPSPYTLYGVMLRFTSSIF